jgi:signal transduction histidine kinase
VFQTQSLIMTGHICHALALILLLGPLVCSDAEAVESKRVMLLHSFGQEVRPWSDYAQSIRSELQRQSPWPLDISDYSLVSARSDDLDPETPFVGYLRALFANRPLDLIVSVGAPAAGFVQRHRGELFAATPMVFTAVERRRVDYSILTANDAVVPIRIDYLALVKNILQVLPDTKNVAVIFGTSPIERFWGGEIRKEVKPLADRIAFTFYDDLSFEEILKHAATLPPHSAILWEAMIVDAAGAVYDGDVAFKRLHAVATAPIFGYYEPNLGEGFVGGPYTAVLDTSRQTAAAAVRILGGEKAGDIRITPIEFATPRFDWREMQRWGISQSQLPTGSIIDFRDPTAWERYRWQIVAIATALLVQTLLIGGLFYERHRRHYAEAASRQHMSELAHVNRRATAGEMSASIAHEVMQPLTAISTNGGAALRWLTKATPDLVQARAALQRMVDAAHRAGDIVETIRLMFKKSDGERFALNVNELIEEVLTLLRRDLGRQGILVETRLGADLHEIVASRVQLQQVMLNLFINAAEAMRSTTDRDRVLRVTSDRQEPPGTLITVEDTGPGMEPENIERIFKPFYTTKSEGMGMGLAICRSIVEAHGGRLFATPGRLCGLALHIALPAGAIGGTQKIRAGATDAALG